MHRYRRGVAAIRGIGVCAPLLLCAAAHAQLIGINYDTGKLYDISVTTGAATLRGGAAPDAQLLKGASDIAYGPDGKHYAFGSGANPFLYRIDITTGAKTFVGGMGLPFCFEGALAFSAGGTAYGTNVGEAENPSFFTANTNTGVATVVDTIGTAPHDINGMAWRAADNMLVGIDREANAFVEINPANGLLIRRNEYDSGAGGPLIGAVGGMCIYNGDAYFVTSGPDPALPGDNSLYKVDMATGAPTLIGATGILGTGFSGLTIVPEPSGIAALVSGLALIALRRVGRRPSR